MLHLEGGLHNMVLVTYIEETRNRFAPGDFEDSMPNLQIPNVQPAKFNVNLSLPSPNSKHPLRANPRTLPKDLTNTEMEDRRNGGLCYWCGNNFTRFLQNRLKMMECQRFCIDNPNLLVNEEAATKQPLLSLDAMIGTIEFQTMADNFIVSGFAKMSHGWYKELASLVTLWI
ncbi:hypothetical protein GOBAR_AA29636 [Gossypium barbadense]|uniref:Uncharacterized protein n=1 Tax=Gossypium barbadense TaxID=3634 RepID=A0A2P5WIY8_GOSBA|nr:hypothetical protein GOBAR_AA29636 [Gossypium barbadense]